MSWLLGLIPGILLVALIQLLAGWLSGLFPLLDTLTFGVLLGIIVNNLLALPPAVRPGVKFIEKRILQWGIILLGIELNFALIGRLGARIILLIIATVVFALFAAQWLGRAFRMNEKLAVLLGVGSSVCGASAMAAVEPIVRPEKEDMALAVAAISLLGAAGVLLYPFCGRLLGMEPVAYGIWAGVSLQGVAHAVAAAFAYSELSGEIGTLVKMGRVLMLAPVAIFLSWRYAGQLRDGSRRRWIPPEVLGFVAVGVLATMGILTRQIDLGLLIVDLKGLSKTFITAAMVAMGLGVSLQNLGARGWRALLLGATLFATIAIASQLMIRLVV